MFYCTLPSIISLKKHENRATPSARHAHTMDCAKEFEWENQRIGLMYQLMERKPIFGRIKKSAR